MEREIGDGGRLGTETMMGTRIMVGWSDTCTDRWVKARGSANPDDLEQRKYDGTSEPRNEKRNQTPLPPRLMGLMGSKRAPIEYLHHT